MKRRGFLGFLGGAAVAVPGMAKQAAIDALKGLSLEGVATTLVEDDAAHGFPTIKGARWGTPAWGAKALAKMALRTPEQARWEHRTTRVSELDPDLASYHSMSLSARITLQRERNFQRALRDETETLNAALAGWMSD